MVMNKKRWNEIYAFHLCYDRQDWGNEVNRSFNRLAVCSAAVVDGAVIIIKRNEIACIKNRKASNCTVYPSKGDQPAWPEIQFLK